MSKCLAVLAAVLAMGSAGLQASEVPRRINGDVLGRFVAYDATTHLLTIIPENRQLKEAFLVPPQALVVLDGVRKGSLTNVCIDSEISLRLAVDRKSASEVWADGPRLNTMIKQIDLEHNTITVTAKNPNQTVTYALAKEFHALGRYPAGNIKDLLVGDAVQIFLSADGKSACRADVQSPRSIDGIRRDRNDYQGPVIGIDTALASVTIESPGRNGVPGERAVDTRPESAVILDGRMGRFADLAAMRRDLRPIVNLTDDKMSIESIRLDGNSEQGVVHDIDVAKRTVTFMGGGAKPMKLVPDVWIVGQGVQSSRPQNLTIDDIHSGDTIVVRLSYDNRRVLMVTVLWNR